jgi:AraC-like DNA-binding protein
MPSLIYTIGSPLCDYSFLSAFYNRDPASPPRLNLGSGANRAVCASLQRFLEHYFTPAGGLRHQAMTKLRLLDLLSELSAHLPMRRSPKSNHEQQNLDAKRMKTLFSFIEQHYAEPISRKQAASLVHLSESRFHTFFHKAAGTNFVSYLTHARVCQAARLLIEETFSVAEVAQRVGFSDQSYFDRRFKEHFGITPLKYRHQAGKPRAAAD